MRTNKTKILIGASEVCGMIHDLGEEYQNQGYQVTTISGNNKFYSYKYDINPDDLIRSFIIYKTRSKKLADLIFLLTKNMGEGIKNGINSIIVRNLLSTTDYYIQIYNSGLWEEERQLKYLKKKRKKIITLFVGSDIRDYFLFKEKFNIRRWDFNDEINLPGRAAKERKLKLHEYYSDLIFSVPDQSMLAQRPYFHLQVPLNVERFIYNVPQRDIPIVLHAPTKPLIKGSDLILDTFNRLKEEGIKFEWRLIENMKHEELLKELTNADILVDEIILNGPGFLSFEAMLSGCAVATKYLEDSPECFRPPVMNINEDNILQQLRILLTNKELRINLAKAGGEYALRNNNIEKVAKDILSKINSDHYDYYPDKENYSS